MSFLLHNSIIPRGNNIELVVGLYWTAHKSFWFISCSVMLLHVIALLPSGEAPLLYSARKAGQKINWNICGKKKKEVTGLQQEAMEHAPVGHEAICLLYNFCRHNESRVAFKRTNTIMDTSHHEGTITRMSRRGSLFLSKEAKPHLTRVLHVVWNEKFHRHCFCEFTFL